MPKILIVPTSSNKISNKKRTSTKKTTSPKKEILVEKKTSPRTIVPIKKIVPVKKLSRKKEASPKKTSTKISGPVETVNDNRFLGDEKSIVSIRTYRLDQKDNIDYETIWRFEPYFKLDSKGAERVWWIGFDPEKKSAISGYGVSKGAIQIVQSEIKLNKSNRNMREQSMLDITQKIAKKIREGYQTSNQQIIEKKTGERTSFDAPMLFQKLDPIKTKLNFPVGVQPKLDGIRCLAMLLDDGTVSMRSRPGIEWTKESKVFFENEIKALLSFLPAGTQLDGEIYGPGLLFETITSIVKDSKNMKKYIDKISYNIFTIIDVDKNTPAELRYTELNNAYESLQIEGEDLKFLEDRIKIVEMRDANSMEEIIEFHNSYLELGYEGSVIYKYANKAKKDSLQWKSSLYKLNRCSNVLKYKATLTGEEMQEDEGTIVDVKEAKGTQKGAAIFTVANNEGKTFDVVPALTIERRREIFQDSSNVIGKKLTYKYQNLTKYGLPRFPIGKEIRDYE
jgi:hypothetical protein